MAVKVLMPKLGLTMTEGKILRWLKQEGDPVIKGEPLLEVMTEKIVTEVESPGSGILVKIFHIIDDVVPITEVIALLAEEGENWSAVAAELGRDSDQRIQEVIVETLEYKGDNNSHEAALQLELPEDKSRLRITPIARRIAKDKGLTKEELKSIIGSGPSGRIVKKDILAFSVQPKKEAVLSMAGTSVEPMSDLRKAIAKRMTQSFTTTPHFYLKAEADIVNLMQIRKRINESLKNDGLSISVNDMLVKITATALDKYPNINSSYTESGIICHQQINVGVAVALDEGLIVPVIKDAAQKSLREISLIGRSLIEKARQGGLALDDITGGTFTLSNLGMYAVDSFTAIINPPEAAILAVGRVVEKPVVFEGEITKRKRVRLTLGLDHRVLDGAQGAIFLGEIVKLIENPYMLI